MKKTYNNLNFKQMKTTKTNQLLQEVETLLTEKEIEFLINTFSDNTIEKMIHKDHDLEELVSKNYESINNYLN